MPRAALTQRRGRRSSHRCQRVACWALNSKVVDDFDFRFIFDPQVVNVIVPVGMLYALLYFKLAQAKDSKLARMRAELALKAAVARFDEQPNDPRLMRARREAEAELSQKIKEENAARNFRQFIIAGPLMRIEVPRTVESEALQDELNGLPPRKQRGMPSWQLAGYAVQVLILVPTFFLLLTDPLHGPDT